jgi:hypothetical protein
VSVDVFVTIASQNFAPQIRCLYDSLRTHHADARLTLCLLEEDANPELFPTGEFDVVLAKDVVGDGFYNMAYAYGITELATATKPFVLKWLLDRGAQTVTYIDPDCFLFSPLEESSGLLNQGLNIVLTPHATEPINDACQPGEIDLLRAGTFNLGFIAVRESAETRRFLDWWSARLRENCVFDPVSGLFVDQKWLDLAPSFFDGVSILRHPGYNVAYWNLFQRSIERAPGGWQVDGEALRFFHFSGFPKDDIRKISRHQNRLQSEDVGPFLVEFETYLARLASNGLKPSDEVKYSYSLRWRGKALESQALRTALRKSSGYEVKSLKDFDGEGPIEELLTSQPFLPPNEMFPISKLLYQAWLERPSIARQFPLFTAESRARFLFWVLDGGYLQLEIDRRLLPWRALSTPVEGALGGSLAVPPMIWLAWLTDANLRRTTQFDSEVGFSQILVELQKQIDEGERPGWLLPEEYTSSVVFGAGSSEITVAQYAVWNVRPDLQDAFDLESPSGRKDFLRWCGGSSPKEELPWMAKLIAPKLENLFEDIPA